jgi:hypothetical protein
MGGVISCHGGSLEMRLLHRIFLQPQKFECPSYLYCQFCEIKRYKFGIAFSGIPTSFNENLCRCLGMMCLLVELFMLDDIMVPDSVISLEKVIL